MKTTCFRSLLRTVLLLGALLCYGSPTRAQVLDFGVEKQEENTYHATCSGFRGLNSLTIRQLPNGDFDLHIAADVASDRLNPIKGKQKVIVSLDLGDNLLISSALFVSVPDQLSQMLGIDNETLHLYYPVDLRGTRRVASQIYMSNGAMKNTELSSSEYMKLLSTKNIKSISLVKDEHTTLCTFRINTPTAETIRAMCRAIGDRTGDHSFYGGTSSAPAVSEKSTPAKPVAPSSGTEARKPIVLTSVKEMIDKPFGLLEWGMNSRVAKDVLGRKSSWPFNYRSNGTLIETAEYGAMRPRYYCYLGLEGHCRLAFQTDYNDKELAGRTLCYTFYSSTLDDALKVAKNIVRELREMNVEMADFDGEYYRYFSGYIRQDGIGEHRFYNHKSYSVDIQKYNEYEVQFEIRYAPNQ